VVTLNNASDYRANGPLSDYVGWANGPLSDYVGWTNGLGLGSDIAPLSDSPMHY